MNREHPALAILTMGWSLLMVIAASVAFAGLRVGHLNVGATPLVELVATTGFGALPFLVFSVVWAGLALSAPGRAFSGLRAGARALFDGDAGAMLALVLHGAPLVLVLTTPLLTLPLAMGLGAGVALGALSTRLLYHAAPAPIPAPTHHGAQLERSALRADTMLGDLTTGLKELALGASHLAEVAGFDEAANAVLTTTEIATADLETALRRLRDERSLLAIRVVEARANPNAPAAEGSEQRLDALAAEIERALRRVIDG